MTGCNTLTICVSELTAIIEEHLAKKVFRRGAEFRVADVRLHASESGYGTVEVVPDEPFKKSLANRLASIPVG